MDSILTSNQLKKLQDYIVDSLPFCSGIFPVSQKDLVMYYGKDDNARQVTLNRHSSVASLEDLVRSCEPATFGRVDEDVYDESYRKAGKLDSDAFSPMLDLYSTGLISLIDETWLSDSSEQRPIRAELYKMNVYGEGSFFKAHVDTPRGENMFGSLVIFYPTAYEGGTLLIRKNGKEWSFDSSSVLSEKQEPQLGYVALYSDVEHEVLPVTSGHRVTITYNLFFDHSSSLPVPISSVSAANSFQSNLRALLDDPEFLPNGGQLGFGLEYAYPSHTSGGGDLRRLEMYLKGVDADVMQTFKGLSLKTSLWAIINRRGDVFACKGEIPDYEGETFGENTLDFNGWLSERFGARVVQRSDKYGKEPDFQVAWIRSPPKDHWRRQTFIHYGNEYSPAYGYHAVCLIVEVGKPGNREVPVGLPTRPVFDGRTGAVARDG